MKFIQTVADTTGATVNAGGRLVVRATRVGADTQLAQMARLVEDAQNGKAEVQRLADRVADVSGAPHRPVPDVGDAAVGDQVAVTGREFLSLVLSEGDVSAVTADLREVRLTL